MKWRLMMGILVMLGSLLGVAPVQAESVDYQVGTELPKNQLDQQATYFDLQVKPKQRQKLTIKITNQSKQAQKYLILTHAASTNSNGVIDYSKAVPADASLQYSLGKLMHAPKEVTVAGQHTKSVQVDLTAPAKRFSGIVLGGITVQKQIKVDKTKKGLSLQNQFAYVTGVQLHSKAGKVQPDLKLRKVQAKQVDQHNYVTANLQNPRATIMHDLKVHATVTADGSSKPFIETQKKQMAMAPNSNFNFPLSTEQHSIKPGKYTLDLTAIATKGRQHWHFKRQFEVSASQADTLNKNTVNPQSTGINWVLIGLISLIGLLLLIIAWFIYKWRQLKTK